MTDSGLPKIIPLFPLPSTVLFPKTYVPLHIFEPRYREMVRDSLEDAGVIGMVLLKENWETAYYGNPPIHRIGCVGRIMQVQHLDDGRYNLVLTGVEKFTVQDEFYNKSYRQAIIEPIRPIGDASGGLPESLLANLLSVLQIYARLRDWENPINAVLNLHVDGEQLVQVLSSELDMTSVEKQFLLESENILQQCRRLIDLIRFMTDEHRFRREAPKPADTGNP